MKNRHKKNKRDESRTNLSGFKLPMGFFIVWSPDGRVRYGKCDPITKKVLEIHKLE